ncbi:glycosyltransferase [Alkalibacillus haloalkaliphilus]|uniref:glycosyltransferase n=1 Tax=Alkalibacillus haloalkaliphilus TaxID=94136 RepID=UPI0029361384|nr:glycosyltransferase [Alkalibacillus haloalkaliphilus]MDV2583310.1 glycosyltransferase [Alkalibacillus haloalkaliphilus]
MSAKVAHLTTVHHPLDPRIYYKQCQSLNKAGYDVTLIAPEANEHIHEDELKTITITKQKNKFKRMIFSSLELYKQAKRLKADYYHFHDPELLPVAWLLKNKHNTVIYDIHEDYETAMLQKEYLPKPLRRIVAKTFKLIEKFFSRKMEKVIAEKYYKEKYPTGQDILNYPIISERILNKENLGNTKTNKLLYTGNVTLERGALHHAELPAIDEQVEMHFVGYCRKPFAQQIKEIAVETQNRIYFKGIDEYVPKDEIENAYMQDDWLAGVAIFPPTDHYVKKELTKFFEYMAAGLPIICSNFEKWDEFILKHNCGITVDPDNPVEIKQAIETLRSKPEYARQLAENGRKAVLDGLHWGVEENKLIKWYEEIKPHK